MPVPNAYPKELRERAVRMVAEIGEPGAIRRVGEKLGVNLRHRPALGQQGTGGQGRQERSYD
jgi:transposase-like protein